MSKTSWINSSVTCSNELLQMATPMLTDHQKLTFISFVWTLDATKTTCQEWWLIEVDGERESKESVQLAYLDHDTHINFL